LLSLPQCEGKHIEEETHKNFSRRFALSMIEKEKAQQALANPTDEAKEEWSRKDVRSSIRRLNQDLGKRSALVIAPPANTSGHAKVDNLDQFANLENNVFKSGSIRSYIETISRCNVLSSKQPATPRRVRLPPSRSIVASWHALSTASFQSRPDSSVNLGVSSYQLNQLAPIDVGIGRPRGERISETEMINEVAASLVKSLRRRSSPKTGTLNCMASVRPSEQDFESGQIKAGQDESYRLENRLALEGLATLEVQRQAPIVVEGHNEEDRMMTSKADAVSNTLENTKVEDTEDMKTLHDQAIAILQPAFDKNIISEAQVLQLIDLGDHELPFVFVVSLLLLYKREQKANFEQIRKTIYEGDSLTQVKPEVFTDARNLRDCLHKIRGGALEIGDQLVTEACANLRQFCLNEDLEGLANGAGNFHDLVQASEVSASYFGRFLKFLETHMPECFEAAEDDELLE